MPYRLDPSEPTDVGLRRVVGEQLDRAVVALRVPGGPDAEAVHEVRKRLKKARSAVRLGRADLGVAVARHANDELRRVGGELALQRDADALVETVDRLRSAPGDGAAPATDGALDVVRGLVAERADAVRREQPLGRPAVLGAARTLAQTSAWLQLVPARRTGWEALAPGLAREYRRGRNLLRALPAEPTVDELHEWRKRVKDLWYHERLLRRLWTDAQRPLVDAADSLATALGQDHDLGLLQAHLAAPGDHDAALVRADTAPVEPLAVDDEVRRLVSVAIGRHRRALQTEARQTGALLYADRPSAWRDRHGAWWALGADAVAADVGHEATGTGGPETVDVGGTGDLRSADPSPLGTTA